MQSLIGQSLTPLIVACLALFVVDGARAQFLFTGAIVADDNVGSGEQSGNAVSNDIRNFIDQFEVVNLERTFQTVDWSNPDQVSLSAYLNLRGLVLRIRFDSGDDSLNLSIPGTDVDVDFDGASRDDSIENLKDWLLGQYTDQSATSTALTTLFQELVAHSPVDPVAGNPNSLQSRMFEAAYTTGTTGVYRPKSGTPEAAQWEGKDHFRMTGRYDRFGAGPWDGNVYELSLDHQFNFRRSDRWALLLDLPFTVSDTESAYSYLVSAGLGVQYRPTDWWNITPSFRVGAAGSFQLGALAFMANANITSSMRWEIGEASFSIGGRKIGTPDFELGIGNLFGWNGTFDDLEISGVRIAYDLDNYALRNGIDLSKRFGSGRFLGGQPVVKLYFIDTWILGSPLFLDHYDELGLQVGTQRLDAGRWHDALAFQVGWVTGRSYDALQLRLSYRF